MRRIVVTGANGSGKSHLAERLHRVRPDVPVVSLDRLKLTTGWQVRPRDDVQADLARALAAEMWILECGPSGLPVALDRAEAVIWLEPGLARRGWRLFARPLRFLGRTRPELPDGNPDRLWMQWRFGARSLWRDRRFAEAIAGTLEGYDGPVHRCRSARDVEDAVALWKRG